MVKDVRTGVETTAILDVMNGELDPFIQAYLRQENQLVNSN
jgi:peptide chain release factor 2